MRLKEDGWEKVRRRVGLKTRKEAIWTASRQRDAERAEARGVVGLERSVSCCGATLGWRAKLDFRSGEPLDDLHRSTAVRAAVKVGGVFGGGSVFFVRRLWRTQQLKAKREELSASSAGQEAEVPDTHEALRKQVQQKAAQELADR